MEGGEVRIYQRTNDYRKNFERIRWNNGSEGKGKEEEGSAGEDSYEEGEEVLTIDCNCDLCKGLKDLKRKREDQRILKAWLNKVREVGL